MVRQGHLIAVVGAFLIGCAFVLLVGGCAGMRSEAPQKEQEQTEATKEQGRSPEATASEEAPMRGDADLQESAHGRCGPYHE